MKTKYQHLVNHRAFRSKRSGKLGILYNCTATFFDGDHHHGMNVLHHAVSTQGCWKLQWLRSSERRSLLDLSPGHRASVDSDSDLFAIDNVAFQTVRNHLSALESMESTDTIFLKTLMDSPVLSHLIKVQDKLEEETVLIPVGFENLDLLTDICQRFDRSYRREGKELSSILRQYNFKAVLDAHDRIAKELTTGKKEPDVDSESPWDTILPLPSTSTSTTATTAGPSTSTFTGPMSRQTTFIEEEYTGPVVYAQPIRVISIRKSPGQPLGVTVESNESNLVVARILSGGLIDRCKLMKIGDVILEVNSVPVRTPQQLQIEVGRARDKLQIKVGAQLEDKPTQISGQVGLLQSPNVTAVHDTQKTLCFMRSLFTYDPALDSLLPCKEIGLGFATGEILQIVDQSDPNWWQAKKIGESVVGLIPSRELEERRAAFVRPEADFVHSIGICGTRISRKKKRNAYVTKENAEYDKAELSLYEEVTRMPPFRRKTLVLVGAHGVGRRTLKNRLLNSDPNRFGAVIPITSRPPLEGEEQTNTYKFISREDFESGMKANAYLESGEKDDNYYGTSFQSVNTVIRSGKMCIIDSNPTVLKILHSSPEYMPYVVFLAAPGAERIQDDDDFARRHGYSSRSLAFDRMSSIRYSSRRARTLESIASLYEEEDNRLTVEESQRIQRQYGPYFDLVVINEDFDTTFRRVAEALEALTTDHQWVPVTWVY